MGVIADEAAKVVGASSGSSAAAPSVGHGVPRTSEAAPATPVSAPESPPRSDSGGPVERSGTAPSTPPETPSGSRPADSAQKVPGPTPSAGDPAVALRQTRAENRSLKALYGWMPREHAKSYRDFFSAYQRDSVGALAEELRPFLDKPDQKARIASLLGFTAPAAGNGAQGHADPEPDYDAETPDGRPWMSPRRAAEWKAWQLRQSEQRLEERLRPVQQFIETRTLTDAHHQMREDATQNAKRLFSEAKTWAHFTDHLPAIRERFAMLSAAPEEGGHGLPTEVALLRAYQGVLLDQVRNGNLRQGLSHAASVQAKVGATTHNPARPASSGGPARPQSIREAAERVVYGRI